SHPAPPSARFPGRICWAPMKELSAKATDRAPAPIERCFALVADVEHYPDWYPAGVKRVEVLERDPDGRPTLVDSTLSLGDGALRKDFRMQLTVKTTAPSPDGVELTRVAKPGAEGEEMVVAWALAPDGGDATQLTVDLRAALNLPPFLPLAAMAKS